MVGGSFNYSKSKSSGSASANSKFREISILPTVGYFIIDKIVIGLKSKLNLTKESYLQASGIEISNSQNFMGIGPFARYYFLPKENIINAFTEVSIFYKETINKPSGNNSDKFKAFRLFSFGRNCNIFKQFRWY